MVGRSWASVRLALTVLGTLAAVASGSQWVVETNSFRIKEPASAAGEFDAAIGDVRAQPQCENRLRWRERGSGSFRTANLRCGARSSACRCTAARWWGRWCI